MINSSLRITGFHYANNVLTALELIHFNFNCANAINIDMFIN